MSHSFREWLSGQRKRDDPLGDFARDVFADSAKPDFATLPHWRAHVGCVASDALDTAWKAYRRSMARPALKLRPDTAETALRVMLEATGEAPKTPPPGERSEKNPEAVRLGSAGGAVGGKARARALAPDEREAAAQVAALARWKRTQD